MPYSFARNPVPIDKTKQGGRNFDASAFTGFYKLGTIAAVNSSKRSGGNNKNLLTDTEEQYLADKLNSALTTIPRFNCSCSSVIQTIAQTQLNNTPSNQVRITIMTYVPPGGNVASNAYPGILTTSQAYGSNFYYIYLDCNPTWFGVTGLILNTPQGASRDWCGVSNSGVISQEDGSFPVSSIATPNNAVVDYPVGSTIWFVDNTIDPITHLTNGPTNHAVDTVNNQTTFPGVNAGTFIRDALLTRHGSSSSYDLKPSVLSTGSITVPTPAYFV